MRKNKRDSENRNRENLRNKLLKNRQGKRKKENRKSKKIGDNSSKLFKRVANSKKNFKLSIKKINKNGRRPLLFKKKCNKKRSLRKNRSNS